jgi:hypothetical protein
MSSFSSSWKEEIEKKRRRFMTFLLHPGKEQDAGERKMEMKLEGCKFGEGCEVTLLSFVKDKMEREGNIQQAERCRHTRLFVITEEEQQRETLLSRFLVFLSCKFISSVLFFLVCIPSSLSNQMWCVSTIESLQITRLGVFSPLSNLTQAMVEGVRPERESFPFLRRHEKKFHSSEETSFFQSLNCFLSL